MRMLATIALLATAHPAFAMNWEGNEDDWRNEFPPAKAYLDALPEAKPLPSPDCPWGLLRAPINPYEQILLPRHNCPAPKPVKLPGTYPLRPKGSMRRGTRHRG